MGSQDSFWRWWPFARPLVALAALTGLAVFLSPTEPETVSLAMVGNSIQYYNDLPRLLETIANGRLHQNSCLHGNADLESHLTYGNGMYEKWMTGEGGVLVNDDDAYDDIYDWGACTVKQLLFGQDDCLTDLYGGRRKNRQRKQRKLEDAQQQEDEEGEDDDDEVDYEDGDDGVDEAEEEAQNDDDYYVQTYELVDDGTNPCLQSEAYYWYLENKFQAEGPPQWDYILINDNSRNPCCTAQRDVGLDLLENVYVPWFLETGATPIFLDSFPYWASKRDMSGLIDIPTFASVTYSGYKQYRDLVASKLPESQQPRIAPVGLAFLLIWEENPTLWEDLMHYDEIHLSPSGTFLEACIVYATIFGKLPDTNVLFNDDGVANLWKTARRMAPVEHGKKEFPSQSLAKFLYHIAHRVMGGEIPRSLQQYDDYQSVYFTPAY